MDKLLIGTTNPAKLAEYKKLLADSGLQLLGLKDLGITDYPKEDKSSFEENAIAKAKFYSQKSGLPSLADDGGLEIQALGEIGLHAPNNLNDEEIINHVINRMQSIPQGKRDCRLTVSIALATPFGIFTSNSWMDGEVGYKSSDTRINGYPFRSVMYLPHYQKYHADLTPEEDGIANHRAAALEKIKDMVKEVAKYSDANKYNA